MKALGTMNIYKPYYGDCSNGGISHDYDEVVIWSEFDEKAPDNAVVILEDTCCGGYRIRAVPANSMGRHTMFGGTFIHTSNGVVPHYGVPIHLHDRVE